MTRFVPVRGGWVVFLQNSLSLCFFFFLDRLEFQKASPGPLLSGAVICFFPKEYY